MKLDYFRPDEVPAPRNEVVDELMINLKVAISYSHLNLILLLHITLRRKIHIFERQYTFLTCIVAPYVPYRTFEGVLKLLKLGNHGI